ncbi:transposase [Streptomyces nodosus]|uniref:transposase n=1 Tax=Streptomyces nodosus TaxID=40318 RepID=UPI0036E7BBC4
MIRPDMGGEQHREDRGEHGSRRHAATPRRALRGKTLTLANRDTGAEPRTDGDRRLPQKRDTEEGGHGLRRVNPVIARRGTEHGSGLGTQRWVVERTFAHLHWFRRLRIRWEIRDDIHEAFLTIGCALIPWRRLAAVQRRHS